MENQLVDGVREEFKTRVFDESFERIRRCLDMVSEDDLWKQPNNQITSIGSSILHIEGNALQWIGSLSDKPFDRKRELEFSPKDNPSIAELNSRINKLKLDLEGMIVTIGERQLNDTYTIQGFNVSGLSALIHVIEHVSYHTGQITLLTKLYTAQDTGYYSEHEL